MKQRDYFWNQDAVRVPPSATSKDRANSMGRNASSILEFNPSNYRGTHTAPTPVDMACWILSAACEITRMCATHLVAWLRLRLWRSTIEINADYAAEAKERLSKAPVTLPTEND